MTIEQAITALTDRSGKEWLCITGTLPEKGKEISVKKEQDRFWVRVIAKDGDTWSTAESDFYAHPRAAIEAMERKGLKEFRRCPKPGNM